MKRSTRQAFTLLELIIVLALIATLLAAATPNLRGMMHGRRLQEEGRRLLAVLHWAPGEAASSGEMLAMWFDTENGEFGVVTADADQETVCHFRLGDGVTLAIEPAQELVGEPFVLIAWPDGTMAPEHECRIVLTHEPRQEQLDIVYDETRGYFVMGDTP